MKHELRITNEVIKKNAAKTHEEQRDLILKAVEGLPCNKVRLQEALGEPYRRFVLATRSAVRKARRLNASGKGTNYRRIIHTETRFGRIRQLHATKGWRSYRGR